MCVLHIFLYMREPASTYRVSIHAQIHTVSIYNTSAPAEHAENLVLLFYAVALCQDLQDGKQKRFLWPVFCPSYLCTVLHW